MPAGVQVVSFDPVGAEWRIRRGLPVVGPSHRPL
jgi:hypothetical protein